ncbi:hypothetical protein C2845_PM07G30510 [Panicum miliaceum]|uniref:CHD3-type chromatin-remodeling factor PICKLE-like n=1 Tax=Panicum miliaceum TaxID=4540 RepID=A0A3L6SUW2_PANMI|nr:hypothetical protein C2845_PM07G30510 [Panicum miliaceum]
MKRRTEEIASAEHTVEAGLEALPRDAAEEDCAYGGEPTPTRNLRRLRKQTVGSNAADAKEHVAVDVKYSDTEDPGNLAPCGSLKVRQILKDIDISNGVAEYGQKLGQQRRSKRLQAKLIGIQDLDGGDTDSDIFEDRHSSSEDEKRRLVPKRSKRLQRKYTSEAANDEVSEDKDTWRSSSDDDKDSVGPRRRSKRYKFRTRSSSNDDGDDSDAINYYGKAIQCRRMSKRLLEKQKVDHISNESCTKASSSMLSTSSSSDNELLCNSVKSSKRSHGPICSICKVPLEWLQVFDRIRAQSYLKKSILIKEVYVEDQRKPEWFEVDRAIACRRKSGCDSTYDILTTIQDNKDFQEYEFLVKWKGLDYCEATWESCCTEGVQAAISKLVERHQSVLKRIDCVSPVCLEGVITEEIHNGALYGYQHQGLQWIFDNFKTRRNVILADEMGLGKTVQVVCFLNHIIKERFTAFPALILAPKSILLQWEKEFGRWGGDLNIIVYQGDKDSRKCIQAHEMYSSEGKGTPLQNNMLELFSLLHYIDPDEFSDPNVDGLFTNIESGNELTVEEKIARIHDILKPRCDACLFLFQGQETKQQPADVFLSLVAASGKLQLLHKLLPKLKERGNHVLIFSQMTIMLDILEDFLCDLGYKYARIDGQTSLSARQESIKEYNRAESETFIFLMSTRAGGLGVDLPGADRVIIYDPDFNPFMDLQAQSRAHRIGQTRPVVVYQLITKCSVEEKILQKSKQKLAIENMLMNSSKKPNADELQSILLHGAKTIIDRKKVSATSIQYDDEAHSLYMVSFCLLVLVLGTGRSLLNRNGHT